MDATVDFDVVCQLGFIKSLDMREVGFYSIEISLDYISESADGSAEGTTQTIAPIGCFSAPSTLNSKVRSVTINPAMLINISHIEDEKRVFQGRSFLIRYKDEIHEFNDGCHWRATLQNIKIHHEHSKTHLSNLGHFIIHFKLMKADVEVDFDQASDFSYDLDREVVWTVCAQQSLQLQDIVKGCHEYYPVRFDRHHFVNLDTMIHVAMTGIRYDQLFCGDSPVAWKNRTLDLSFSMQDAYLSSEPTPRSDTSISNTVTPVKSSPAPTTRNADFKDFKSTDLEGTIDRTVDMIPNDSKSKSESESNRQTSSSALDKLITPIKSLSKGIKLPSSQDLDVSRFLFHEEDYMKPNSTNETKPSVPVTKSVYTEEIDVTSDDPPAYTLKPPRPSYESSAGHVDSPNLKTTHSTPNKTVSAMQRPQRKSFSPAKDTSLPMDTNDTSVTPQKSLDSALMSINAMEDEFAHFSINPQGGANSRRTTLVDNQPSRRSLSSSPTQKTRKSTGGAGGGTASTTAKSTHTTHNTHSTNHTLADTTKRHTSSSHDLSPTKEASKMAGRHRLVSERSKGVRALWSRHADPIICNFNYVVHGINSLFSSIEESSSSSTITLSSASNISKDASTTNTSTRSTELCYVIMDESTLREMDSVESSEEFETFLFARVEQSNAYLSRKWIFFVSTLPRFMPQLVAKMKAAYSVTIKKFWKKQLYVQCSSLQYAHAVPLSPSLSSNWMNIWKVCGDEDILAFLNDMLVPTTTISTPDADNVNKTISSTGPDETTVFREYSKEYRESVNKKSSAKLSIDDQKVSKHRREKHKFKPAHGSKVFDVTTHKDVSKLPYMFLQQYTSQTLSSKPYYPNDGIIVKCGELLNTKDEEGEYCQGNIYDIRDLSSLSRQTSVAKVASVSRMESTSSHMSTRLDTLTEYSAGSMNSQSQFTSFRDALDYEDKNDVQSESDRQFSTKILNDTSSQIDLNDPDSINTKDTHLIILQHGFLGCSYDMKLLQNALHVEGSPYFHVYIASSNDAYNEEGIAAMANRLTSEIYSYCSSKLPFLLEDNGGGRVSFIGHSMGGLVIRKALESKTLRSIKDKLHTFVSLATPHLGTVYADSQVVSVGQWALSKLKKTSALKELALQDSSTLSKTIVYQLSENNVLGYFNHVVFVSSPKDMYVPRYSASVRMNYTPSSSSAKPSTPNSSNNMLDNLKRMSENILNQIDPDRLLRVTIENNEGGDKSINTTIGRTAHICYLDNPIVATQIIITLMPLLV